MVEEKATQQESLQSEELVYYWGIGRRKTSVARVRISEGKGYIMVNGKRYNEYFCNENERAAVISPLKAVDRLNNYNVVCKVRGGGKSGQADAVSLGIARALKLAEPNLSLTLRENGYLTRDPRMKERKKYGRRGARRGFQFSKR